MRIQPTYSYFRYQPIFGVKLLCAKNASLIKYCQETEGQEESERKYLERLKVEDFGSSSLGRMRKICWNVTEYPETSLAARVSRKPDLVPFLTSPPYALVAVMTTRQKPLKHFRKHPSILEPSIKHTGTSLGTPMKHS